MQSCGKLREVLQKEKADASKEKTKLGNSAKNVGELVKKCRKLHFVLLKGK